MKKNIGDMWRESSNEVLAQLLLEVLMEMLKELELDLTLFDMEAEYETLLDFYNTEFESEVDSNTGGFRHLS